MSKILLEVNMFGAFTVAHGDECISDQSDRSKKLWLLLAFLMSRRPRAVTAAELVELLWGSDGERSSGVLKTTVHRLRALLDKLAPGAGHSFIIHEGGCYRWNAEAELGMDTERFESLCEEAFRESEASARAEKLLSAAQLYKGGFLERLSSEAWVVPIAAHYHNLYIKVISELLPLLKAAGKGEKARAIAEKAVALEPYHEEFHRFLMQSHMESGRPEAAVDIYEALRRSVLDEFGVIPEEETRAIYHEAVRSLNGHIVHVDFIKNQLRENDSQPGCMVCDYEFFKVLYRAEARAIARNGNCVHVSLITVTGEHSCDLAPRSLERAMNNMEDMLRANLRKGDIVSRCSASQFVVMLPQANYENSRMVSERVLRAFFRRYPHSPARLDYSVWALEPME